MKETTKGAHPLDHLVMPTASIAVARERLGRLGFTIAPDALHPFGTENACVFLADGTYLEPLGIASREDCEAAAIAGNVFVARDQAYRFRRGQEGFSAVVFGTDDAAADDAVFRKNGVSGGEMLSFSRAMVLADGSESEARFKLAFAADLRSPDFFLFTCQRLKALPSGRSRFEAHENGVTGLGEVVLSEPNPTDFQYLLQLAVHEREVSAHSFGMDIMTANGIKISVLNPAGMAGFYGKRTSAHARGLRGRAVVLKVSDLAATERLLSRNGIPFTYKDGQILVPEAPGQGALFVFGE